MSLFGKILDKLGLRKEEEATAGTSGSASRKPTATGTSAKPGSGAKPAASGRAAGTSATATGVRDKVERDDMMLGRERSRAPMSKVDVVEMLEQKAKGTGLNWKQSISDLLFLLEIDNSRAAREELARELGIPEEKMSDSAKMNTWLHKEVLGRIAANGGNIPKELLD